MIMTPGLRRFALTSHVTSSVGWLGAVAAFLALAIAGLSSQDEATVRAAYIAMHLTTLIPLVGMLGMMTMHGTLGTGMMGQMGGMMSVGMMGWGLVWMILVAVGLVLLITFLIWTVARQ